MRAGLMFRDRDFSMTAPTVYGRDTLCADFEIKRIIERMAAKDLNIELAVNSALFNPLCDIDEILYRQQVLKDCLAHPAQVRELYELVSGAEHFQAEMVKGMRTDPQVEDTLTDAITILRTQMEHLKLTRDSVAKNTAGFASEGFTGLAKMLKEQLPDSFFSEVAVRLKDFRDRDGMLVGVSLGSGLQGVNYTMLRRKAELFRRPSNSGVYTVNSQDQSARSDMKRRTTAPPPLPGPPRVYGISFPCSAVSSPSTWAASTFTMRSRSSACRSAYPLPCRPTARRENGPACSISPLPC